MTDMAVPRFGEVRAAEDTDRATVCSLLGTGQSRNVHGTVGAGSGQAALLPFSGACLTSVARAAAPEPVPGLGGRAGRGGGLGCGLRRQGRLAARRPGGLAAPV